MKDPGFSKEILRKWICVLPEAGVVRYPDTGHFVSEEKSLEMVEAIRLILSRYLVPYIYRYKHIGGEYAYR